MPGLRREELAQLAGVSVDCYVRVEQGRANVSRAVLDALARALRLNEEEHAHLRNLARPPAAREPVDEHPPVRPELARLLDALHRNPAYVIDHRTDVIAWNPLAAALFVDFDELAARERNWARLVFLDPVTSERFADWDAKARDCVGYLRLSTGRKPDDDRLAALVDELSTRSATFRQLWGSHEVKEKAHGIKAIRHPVVGEIQLDFQTVRLTDDPDQVLVTFTAAAGNPAETSLRLLGSWTTTKATAARSREPQLHA